MADQQVEFHWRRSALIERAEAIKSAGFVSNYTHEKQGEIYHTLDGFTLSVFTDERISQEVAWLSGVGSFSTPCFGVFPLYNRKGDILSTTNPIAARTTVAKHVCDLDINFSNNTMCQGINRKLCTD